MRIGLLGGSFDPVHAGHLSLARAAMTQLNLRRVYFVLAPRAPLKRVPVTPAKDRLAMLRLALRGRRDFAAATWELGRNGPSYTVRTLRERKAARPADDLYFILGSDAAARFSRWREPRAILRLATLVVGRRPGHRSPRLPAWARGRTVVLRGTFPDVSSTAIRKGLLNASFRKRWLPEPVARYALRRGLYGARRAGRRR